MDNNTTDVILDVTGNITHGNASQFLTYTQNQILEIVAPHIVLIDRVVSPVWYVLGLFGNPISAIIWLSRKIRKTNSSAVYFGSLAIVQTLYLLIHIVMDLNLAWDVNTYHRPTLCETFNFLMIAPQYLVPMLVLDFTTERYIAVCHPFVKEKYCTVTRAKIVICCMAVVSLVLGSVQTYIWVKRPQPLALLTVPMIVLGFTTERYIAVCHPFVKEMYCTVTRAKIVICCMAVVSLVLRSVQTFIWVKQPRPLTLLTVPMLVLGFTTERYIAVCHPFVKEKYCTVTRAKIVICCMAVVSLVLGSVQTYIWAWHTGLGCVFRPNIETFNTVWSWTTEMIIFGVIPIGCLIINVLVILEIKRLSIQSAAHGQEGSSSNAASTTTLLAVSFYFIFTLLPATIVYVIQLSVKQGDASLPFSEWNSDPVWKSYLGYLTARKIVEELCLSNHAAYFIIYYTTGVYFRREFKNLLGLHKFTKHNYRSKRAMDSDYSLVHSNGKTMTETIALDATSDH